MTHWVKFSLCAVIGLLLFWCGLQVPAHLRAVDGLVLSRAGQTTPSFLAAGLGLVEQNQLGPARLFSAAANNAWLPERNQLADAVDGLARSKSEFSCLGGPATGPAAELLSKIATRTTSDGAVGQDTRPFAELIVPAQNRERTLQFLKTAPSPLAHALLQFRQVTNTVLFPASSSSYGQALDAAIGIVGLLDASGQLSLPLNKELLNMAVDTERTGDSQLFEQALMDLMSLGQRLDWAQLCAFVSRIDDAKTLRTLAHVLQDSKDQAVVFAAVCTSDAAAGVARYLTTFSETGMKDLRASLTYGGGGIQELVRREKRLCDSRSCAWIGGLAESGNLLTFVTKLTPATPWAALTMKWLLYLLGGFFVAAAFHCVRAISPLEQPLQVRGFHFAWELLFALGFLLLVLLLSEPFLAQGSQVGTIPFRLRLPMVGSATSAESANIAKSFMNPMSLLTLLLFFVLQGLIYLACRLKLAEIRRQKVPARLRLKLLENEDHLFDAGLYLGFVGTIISLIFVSLGVIKLSLMGGYSSTAFGIIFVSFFKIFSLRPLRRKLLLEAEAGEAAGMSGQMSPVAT